MQQLRGVVVSEKETAIGALRNTALHKQPCIWLMQGGRKSSDGQGAAVGGVALAAAQAIAAGKKVTLPMHLTFPHLHVVC